MERYDNGEKVEFRVRLAVNIANVLPVFFVGIIFINYIVKVTHHYKVKMTHPD